MLDWLEMLTITVAIIASLGLIASGTMQLGGERALGSRLDSLQAKAALDLGGDGTGQQRGMLATILAGGSEGRAEIEHDLAAAGYVPAVTILAFGLIRLAATVGIGLALYVVMMLTRPPSLVNTLVPVAASALTFLTSKYILKASSARRSRKVSAELPFTLDIFVMMVESGASLDQCFRIFASSEGRAAPIVQAAVILLVEDIQRGMPYDLALARWSDRLGVTGARELAGVLRQSLNHGTELAATLREFSREFSERRIFVARESIGKKTTQMTVAMLVLLMPALMIVLAGPAVSTLGSTLTSLSK
ncbi:type II secretion system F family protein [Glacieibacterium sp.]|uniref:type II secretion system F family protein n=1 Tax=Glacieibacterium sp. TaxID=2860237 RepID=UPI003B00E150